MPCEQCEDITRTDVFEDLYDRPFDERPRRAFFCSEACRDQHMESQSGFGFACCPGCERYVCEANPRNGYESQWSWLDLFADEDDDDEYVCNKCYEDAVLEQGQSLVHLFLDHNADPLFKNDKDVVMAVDDAARAGRLMMPHTVMSSSWASTARWEEAGWTRIPLATELAWVNKNPSTAVLAFASQLVRHVQDPAFEKWFLASTVIRSYDLQVCLYAHIRPFVREARQAAMTFLLVVARLNQTTNSLYHRFPMGIARTLIAPLVRDSYTDPVWLDFDRRQKRVCVGVKTK